MWVAYALPFYQFFQLPFSIKLLVWFLCQQPTKKKNCRYLQQQTRNSPRKRLIGFSTIFTILLRQLLVTGCHTPSNCFLAFFSIRLFFLLFFFFFNFPNILPFTRVRKMPAHPFWLSHWKFLCTFCYSLCFVWIFRIWLFVFRMFCYSCLVSCTA